LILLKVSTKFEKNDLQLLNGEKSRVGVRDEYAVFVAKRATDDTYKTQIA
jgi:hypothetical protein